MPLFNIIITKDGDEAVANNCCPFDFGSVMGQEDLYREDPPGDRVENTLQARIVWATTVPATSRVIWGQIDEVGFPNDTGVVATGAIFHEVFFPVNQVNTEYKFQIITTSSDCEPAGETLQSETFYFEVGGEISIGENSFEYIILTTTQFPLGISYTTENDVEGEYTDFGEVLDAIVEDEFTNAFAIQPPDETLQIDLENSQLFTNYSTSVS